MTVTSNDRQVRSHRTWAILVTIVAVLTAGYFVYDTFFASITLPTDYAVVDPFLSADESPIPNNTFFGFEEDTYRLLQDDREISIPDLLRVGNLTYALGNPSRASYYFRRALSMSRDINDDLRVVIAMNNLGISETVRGELNESERNLLDALELAKTYVPDDVGPKDLAEKILLNVGWHYLQTGDYNEALERYMDAEEAFESTKDSLGMALAWSGMGRAYGGQQLYYEATSHHQQALLQFSRLKQYRAQAGEVYNLAEAELRSGQYEDARRDFADAAHAYSDRLDDWPGFLRAKAALGRVAEASGQIYPAMLYATEVMEAYRDHGHRLGETRGRVEMARLAEKRDKPDEAKTNYRKAAEQMKQYNLLCDREEVMAALERLGSGPVADDTNR